MPTRFAAPHRIDETTMAAFFKDYVVEGASATTADGTQRKRLVHRGDGSYATQRRYILGIGDGWADVYAGTDLSEAVRVYNSLS